jgi:DNA-binding CsgD family transcriptional regulator
MSNTDPLPPKLAISPAASARMSALAKRIDRSDARFTLIDALPGTGKSLLLRCIAERRGVNIRPWPDHGSGGKHLELIDLAPGTILDVCDVRGRAVICGGQHQLSGHARLRLYGELQEIGNADLFLDEADDPVFSSSGGWPALSAHFNRTPDDLVTPVAFIRENVLTVLDEVALVALNALALARDGIPCEGLEEAYARSLVRLQPLVSPARGRWRFRCERLRTLFEEAFFRGARGVKAARLLEFARQPAAAIGACLAVGDRVEALSILDRSGGVMLGHLHGPDEARAVLKSFGKEAHHSVMALRAMTAMKAGHTGHAARLIEQTMRAAVPSGLASSPPDPGGLTPEMRMSWLLLGVYSDRPMGGMDFHSEYATLLAELPPDSHLVRGAVYNVALDEQIRAGRQGEAIATAARALSHYRAGQAPYLSFYIHVHLALMHLLSGSPAEAAKDLEGAKRELAATPFDTPQDDRFLALLTAQVAYEQGRGTAMIEFAESAFERFAYGELWPSIATLALAFGAEALLQLRGTDAALRYLEAWRVQTWRTRRFRLLIEQREVQILQSARRWREARLKLETMATRIGAIWIDSAGENLADLRDPEDVAQALIWLRQQVFERPRDQALQQKLAFAHKNPHLSWRQRRQLAVWQAWVARRRGQVPAARQLLADALSTCVARDCRAPLFEERLLVVPLVNDPRMAGGPMRTAPMPPGLRSAAPNPLAGGPLSRKEWRALLLLAEGCSNKEIAREMMVSLPTVKFHLKNLYAKLGVSDRRSAVDTARRKALIDS